MLKRGDLAALDAAHASSSSRRRFVLQDRVLVSVKSGREATPLRGMVLNLSAGGFCGQLHGPRLQPADRVVAHISPLGRRDVLCARASIAWLKAEIASDAIQYGFSWVDGEDLPTILGLIRDAP